MTCLLELSTGKLQKCKKRGVFDAKSLQTVELPTGSSKYVQNRVLFRKHRILHNKIKPQCFAPFPWSSNVNLTFFLQLDSDLHKCMGALDWESLCEQKVWSSELGMYSFLGNQTFFCKKHRILRNIIMLGIPKYGFQTKAPMEMNLQRPSGAKAPMDMDIQNSSEAKMLKALHYTDASSRAQPLKYYFSCSSGLKALVEDQKTTFQRRHKTFSNQA